MEIQGEKTLSVPPAEVWRALNDPALLQRCLPGCDTFEPIGENRYKVMMQATVGPIRARFTGNLELVDVVAPESYAIVFEGSGGVAGFGKGRASVALDEIVQGTRLRYGAQAQVGGRLAQVGARLIDGVTRRMADDFFTRFVRELGKSEGSGESSAGATTPISTPAPADRAAPPMTQTMSPRSAQEPQPTPAAAPVLQPTGSSSNLVAVVAAAVSATAAAVAVLATAFAVLWAR